MFKRILYLYIDGFREMTVGKVLWTIIIIKVFIIFAVLKIFLFPDILKTRAKGNEAEYVANEMLHR